MLQHELLLTAVTLRVNISWLVAAIKLVFRCMNKRNKHWKQMQPLREQLRVIVIRCAFHLKHNDWKLLSLVINKLYSKVHTVVFTYMMVWLVAVCECAQTVVIWAEWDSSDNDLKARLYQGSVLFWWSSIGAEKIYWCKLEFISVWRLSRLRFMLNAWLHVRVINFCIIIIIIKCHMFVCVFISQLRCSCSQCVCHTLSLYLSQQYTCCSVSYHSCPYVASFC